jgi:transitional endoplasmic reticulum ATPase
MREVSVEVPKDITFNSIGGLKEAKQLITDNIVNSIKNHEAFAKVGIAPVKGIFLYGPPGTGKSLLAKAIANECGINLISVKGPEILSKWVGESEERIRFLFAKAREVAPCVLLFDEIDAIARSRSEHTGQYVDKVLNQILCEMDEIQSSRYVFVVAVTNTPEVIDPALIRSGRFDYKIHVPLPDKKAREEIFGIHLRHVPLSGDVKLSELAEMTETCSGADIAEICRGAGFQALREMGFNPDTVKVERRHFDYSLAELKRARERINPPKQPIGFMTDSRRGAHDSTNQDAKH